MHGIDFSRFHCHRLTCTIINSTISCYRCLNASPKKHCESALTTHAPACKLIYWTTEWTHVTMKKFVALYTKPKQPVGNESFLHFHRPHTVLIYAACRVSLLTCTSGHVLMWWHRNQKPSDAYSVCYEQQWWCVCCFMCKLLFF